MPIPYRLKIWSSSLRLSAGHSEMIHHYDDVSTDCTIRVILHTHTHTLVLTTNHDTADLHHLQSIHNSREERKVSQCIYIQDTSIWVICMHMNNINYLSHVFTLSLTHTHNLWLPPSAVRQTEGRGDDEGSQVARVQAVVCTVISVQVFKQPDAHRDGGWGWGFGEIVDIHTHRDVR